MSTIRFSDILSPPGPFFGQTADAIRHPGRAFIGDGYLHNQGLPGSVEGGSWLQSLTTPSGTITTMGYLETQARVTSVTNNGIGVTGASRTMEGSVVQALGLCGAAVNAGSGLTAWGGYFEATRANELAKYTHGVEVSLNNIAGSSPMGGSTPYRNYADGMTGLLRVTAGVGADEGHVGYAVDYGMEFAWNKAAVWTGINFRWNAIMREGDVDDGSMPGAEGYARAIAMAHDQGLSWYSRDPAAGGGTQAEVVRLYSTISDPAVRIHQVFGDTTISWNEQVSPGAALFQIDYRSNAASNVYTAAGGSNEPATLGTRGSAADVSLLLAPKGSGRVVFGSLSNCPEFADDSAAAAGGLGIGAIYRTGSALKVRAA